MGKSDEFLKTLKGRKDLGSLAGTATDLAQELMNWRAEQQINLQRHGTPKAEARSILLLALMMVETLEEDEALTCVGDAFEAEYEAVVMRVYRTLLRDEADAAKKAKEPPKSSKLTVRKMTAQERAQRPVAALGLGQMNVPPATFPMQGLRKK